MNKIVMSMLYILSVLIFATGEARANVIYDVSVMYGASNDLTYSFTMEFLNSVGVKHATDLVSLSPAYDFQSEALTYLGITYTPTSDTATNSLTFDPSTLLLSQFNSHDEFDYLADPLWQARWPFFDRNLAAGQTLNGNKTYLGAVINVTEREQPVPEPQVLALFGAGLLAFRVTRRRTSSTRQFAQ